VAAALGFSTSRLFLLPIPPSRIFLVAFGVVFFIFVFFLQTTQTDGAFPSQITFSPLGDFPTSPTFSHGRFHSILSAFDYDLVRISKPFTLLFHDLVAFWSSFCLVDSRA